MFKKSLFALTMMVSVINATEVDAVVLQFSSEMNAGQLSDASIAECHEAFQNVANSLEAAINSTTKEEIFGAFSKNLETPKGTFEAFAEESILNPEDQEQNPFHDAAVAASKATSHAVAQTSSLVQKTYSDGIALLTGKDSSDTNSAFSRAWNAELFGYEGAGKWAIVSTAAALSMITAYVVSLSSTPTFEVRVAQLVAKAQKNPNVLVQELPALLAQCSDDERRTALLAYVLSHVHVTPEIEAAFSL